MNRFWLNFVGRPLYEGEGGAGGSGGDGSGAGDDKGAGGAKDGAGGAKGGEGTGGAEQKSVSLRAQLAAGIPEAERGDFTQWGEQFTSDADWAKSALSLRRSFDARVPVPKADDKPEVHSKYFERVGKPTEAKLYTYDFGKDEKGEAVKLSDKDMADFEGYKEYAHKHHFTQAQFKAGMDFLLERDRKDATSFTAQINAAHEASVDRLREQWGADFENNVNHAVEGGILYAPSEESWRSFTELPLANGMKVGDHPTFVETFAKIGRMTSEDQRHRNIRESGEAESVRAEIARLEDEAIKAGELPSDEKWHKRIEPLYKKLYPKKHTGGSAGYGT
jgi:hypothetical protein